MTPELAEHKQRCTQHALRRFNERFMSRKKFQKYEDICILAIKRANTYPRIMRTSDSRNMHKVKVMTGLPVLYVVWDNILDCPVTVMPHSMASVTYRDLNSNFRKL